MRGDDRTVRGAIMVGASQGKLETAVSDRFGAVEARLAAIEARMDLLLEGLDITVTEALGFAYRRDPLTVTEPSLRAVRVTVPSRSVR